MSFAEMEGSPPPVEVNQTLVWYSLLLTKGETAMVNEVDDEVRKAAIDEQSADGLVLISP